MKILLLCVFLQAFTLVLAKEKNYMADIKFFKEKLKDNSHHISTETNKISVEETSVFKLPVHINPEFIKYGTYFTVNIRKITVSSDCKANSEDFLGKFDNQELFGALVEVKYPCSSIDIANDLITNGTPFVFLRGDFSTNIHLDSIAHHIDNLKDPVFELDNIKDKVFLEEIEKMGPNNQIDIEFISNTVMKDNFNIDFYYSPTSKRTLPMVILLESLSELFQEKMNLKVHVALYSNLRNPESMHCAGGGKYCASSSSYFGKNTPTGRDVVKEMVRERCLFNMWAPDWMLYMKGFYKACYPKISDTCHQDALLYINVNFSFNMSDFIPSTSTYKMH